MHIVLILLLVIFCIFSPTFRKYVCYLLLSSAALLFVGVLFVESKNFLVILIVSFLVILVLLGRFASFFAATTVKATISGGLDYIHGINQNKSKSESAIDGASGFISAVAEESVKNDLDAWSGKVPEYKKISSEALTELEQGDALEEQLSDGADYEFLYQFNTYVRKGNLIKLDKIKQSMDKEEFKKLLDNSHASYGPPIHLAVLEDCAESLMWLYNSGANMSAKNEEGLSAAAYSFKNDKSRCCEAFECMYTKSK